MGSELWLGYSHYIGGVLQNPPHKDVIEDFEEIPLPPADEAIETEIAM